VIGGRELVALTTSVGIALVVGAVVVYLVSVAWATHIGRRSGRRGISQRLTALGSRLGLDPPEDESNIETSLAYLEQVTGGAAQAVAESSSDAIRLRRSLDTLTQGVVLCDENGSVIYRNGRANALMVSRHGDALAAQAVTELLEGAWHEGAAERTLDLYGPPRRTLQVRARQIDDGRRPLGVIALIEDISERRRLEEIRRDFVANVSHELKTPLALVRMFGEMLQSGRVASEAKRKEYLEIIVRESERLSNLIENVLDFAKVDRGRKAYEFAEGDVGAAVGRAAGVYRYRAERDGVDLAVEVEANLPPARIDERAIQLAVINLVDNALKYASRSKVVTISAQRQGDSIAIRVTDTGPGVPSDERERIFERFVRGASASLVEGEKEAPVRGSGIGLALVKHIAESHGGRAWVESAVGQGSTFIVTIPASA
jgi:signal transduction histidine kinase